MRQDQHLHDIFDLYLFMEREDKCEKCKLFHDNIVGNLVEIYEEFVRVNNQDVEDDKKMEMGL